MAGGTRGLCSAACWPATPGLRQAAAWQPARLRKRSFLTSHLWPLLLMLYSLQSSPSACLQFVRECQTMAHLPAHPNVLPLLAAAEQPRLMVVTPFCSQ